MAAATTALFSLIAISSFFLARAQEQTFIANQSPVIFMSEPSDICVGCICEAASHCNRTLGCEHGMCGLFRITKPYWEDAGKLIIAGDNPNDEEAWQRCCIDPFCAGKTVLAYAKRFRKDCDNDGRIDCIDYAMVHYLGGYGCGTRPLEGAYKRNFEKCYPPTTLPPNVKGT